VLVLTLPSISEVQRRPEKELWREFELARPRILGALLYAASHGLRMLPDVRLDRVPRMAGLIEAAGVTFIDENGGGPGVRLRERSKGKSRRK
jgi:hypothetical protein